MAAIDEVLDSAVDGRPGTVMIEGVAGIGKTRLLDEVIGRARASGLRVGVGRADPDDRHTPFVPLLSALFDPSDPIVDRTALSELQALRGWEALTAAELNVVRLVGGGLTNRQTAARLYVSPHTVDAHLRHVYEKLGINSRMELSHLVGEHDAVTVET
jgi:DNA-binding CsgD family transcriptional regulator